MGQADHPQPVKYFVGILAARPEWLGCAENLLMETFGALDARSRTWTFDYTDYYEHEMGGPLLRKFVSLDALEDPGALASRKLVTNQLEETAKARVSEAARPVNLDIGYMALSKLVLATTKDATHRVYLGSGIYAEVTLCYARGRFEPFPWTYPDYRSPSYHKFFQELRLRLKGQLKETQRES